MDLYYCKVKGGNIGDDINLWLWPNLLPNLFNEGSVAGTFVGAGTIIDHKLNALNNLHIFCSGVGYGALPNIKERSDVFIHGVRGPLSAKALGVSDALVVTDSAIALALDPEVALWMQQADAVKAQRPQSQNKVIGFMPHHSSADLGQWDKVCEKAGFVYLDPRADSKKTIQQMLMCDLILAEAMHGAIIADTLRLPWLAVSSSVEISTFKWVDWCASMHVPYQPIWIEKSSFFEEMRDQFSIFEGRKLFLFKENEKDVCAGTQIHMPPMADVLLLKDYDKRSQGRPNKSSVQLSVWRKILCHISFRLYKAHHHPLLGFILKPYQMYKVRKSVKSLQRVVSAHVAILSENSVFENKLQKMRVLLEKIHSLR